MATGSEKYGDINRIRHTRAQERRGLIPKIGAPVAGVPF